MDFDLRAKKLEKEAERRRLEATKKRDRERKLQEEQNQREIVQAELAIHRKLEEERIEQARLEAEQLEFQLTGGVSFDLTNLIPYIIDGEDDRIVLSENALTILNGKDAFSKGVIHFELRDMSTNALTHCGVREFSATDGTIGLTQKIIDSLTADGDVKSLSTIHIKYILLPKVTYVKFEPIGHQIFAVGPIKQCLEENLRAHATCTIGDILTVWYRGKSFRMRVKDLKPGSCGSLIDSDVEVEFYIPEDGFASSQPISSTTLSGDRTADESDTVLAPSDLPTDQEGSAGYRLGSLTSSVAFDSLGSSPRKDEDILPPEPSEKDGGCIHVKVRTEGGKSLARRFMLAEPVRYLFGFVSDAMGVRRSALRLCTRNPDRTLVFDDFRGHLTSFQDLGMSKRELFMVTVVS